jgi:phosphatidylinositol 4-kinase
LKPYEIIVTSENSGLLEFVPNTISMDAMKKYIKVHKYESMRRFFREYFG